MRAQTRVRFEATLISPLGTVWTTPSMSRMRRPPQVEVLDRAGHAGQAHDVALAELVLDEDERAVEVVADERLGAEADGDADDAEPGDGRPDVEAELVQDHQRGDGHDEEADDVRRRAGRCVSIRFLSSTALSSWAVPSVASRSSSALTMPCTNMPASHAATSATTMISRIGSELLPRVAAMRSLEGRLVEVHGRSLAESGAGAAGRSAGVRPVRPWRRTGLRRRGGLALGGGARRAGR